MDIIQKITNVTLAKPSENNVQQLIFKHSLGERTKPRWGTEIGVAYQTPGFSNKGDEQVIDVQKNLFFSKEITGFVEDAYVGQTYKFTLNFLRYQCVEYARYFQLVNFQAGFLSVDNAFEIFNLTHLHDYQNGGEIEFLAIPNGSTNAPKVGDLLIYQRNPETMPAGHVLKVVSQYSKQVAVIVEVDFNGQWPYIKIAEQNYDDVWDGSNYARQLQVLIDDEQSITIKNLRVIPEGEEIAHCKDYDGSENEVIMGWMRVVDRSINTRQFN